MPLKEKAILLQSESKSRYFEYLWKCGKLLDRSNILGVFVSCL